MESEALAKTLEVLKAVSDLEVALAEFYLFCSEIRETEKDFWLEFVQDEQNHARKVQEMARMLGERESLLVPNTSFNVTPVHHLKTFIARSMKRLQNNQIPTDFKTLISIAWNIEYSILEIKYNDLFSIAEQEYEKIMQTILTETVAHRGKLGSKISAIRNNSYRGHSRPAPKVQNETPKKAIPKVHVVKVHKSLH
jgi:rubrerythrin